MRRVTEQIMQVLDRAQSLPSRVNLRMPNTVNPNPQTEVCRIGVGAGADGAANTRGDGSLGLLQVI